MLKSIYQNTGGLILFPVYVTTFVPNQPSDGHIGTVNAAEALVDAMPLRKLYSHLVNFLSL